MRLIEACEIAEDCGLTTLNEAILNIEIHCTMFFPYEEIQKEIKELYDEFNLIENMSIEDFYKIAGYKNSI